MPIFFEQILLKENVMGMKCEKCEREFLDSKSLEQHAKAKHAAAADIIQPSPKFLKRQERKEERKAERSQELKSAKTGKFLKYGVFGLLIIAIGYGVTTLTASPSGNSIKHDITAGTGSGSYAAGAIPTGAIHWHPHLRIILNGQEQVIPANIGISPAGHQPVHTHETDGIIHLENPKPTEENMKVGYFFQIWGKKFNKDCIFEFCTSGDKKVKFTVNGKENPAFENHIMSDGDKMVIEYG